VNCTVTMLQEPGTPIPESGETTFRLQVSPQAATDYRFDVAVESDDPLKAVYTFRFRGHPATPESTSSGSSSGRCTLGAGTAWSLALIAALAICGRRMRAPRA
jgi:hypothetical protein